MKLLLATRKGLMHLSVDRKQARITQHDFAGDALSQILVDPRNGCFYAAQNLGHFGVKMKRSRDRGHHWEDIAAPAFPQKPADGPWKDDATPWNVEQVWVLAAGGADQPGELWAGCIPAGLFRSTDYGASWQLMESLWLNEARREWFGGGYDHAGIHSVLVDPRDPAHLTLGISCGGIWTSTDRGHNWKLIGEGQRADFLPAEQAGYLNQQDPHCLAMCQTMPDVIWNQHHAGQFRSSNGGHLFERIKPQGASDFGFVVAADPGNPMRAWFTPAIADSKRYPADGALCVLRTDDGGQTYQQLRKGLPQHSCYDLIYRHGLVVDGSGRQLAMASSTGHLWTSFDGGTNWQVAQMLLPPVYALCMA